MSSINLAVLPVVLLSTYFILTLARRYLKLSHIPGPRLAAWTDLWLLRKYWTGVNSHQLLWDLDHEFGPVVRYGPNRVLLSDPNAITTVYGTTNVFEKAPSYDVPVVKINGKLVRSLATIRDEKLVSTIKRQIAFAFSSTSLHEYEHHVDITIEAFLTKLKNHGRPTVDLMPLLSFFSFDTVCRLAFSDALSEQSHCEVVLDSARERFRYWHKWFALPGFETLVFKNRFLPGVGTPSTLGTLAQKRLVERMEKGGAGVHHDLLDRFLQAQRADADTFSTPLVVGLIITTIHAGSETTAHTLGNLFWELLKNPSVYQKLKNEIHGAEFSSPPTMAEIRKHPFIEACLKESGRLHNVLSDPMERIVPSTGTQIGQTWLPGGTVVGKSFSATTYRFGRSNANKLTAANHRALALNPSIYGEDAHEFNPDRWLKASTTELAAMERANFAFSQGKRNCLGMHMAWLEMLKFVPALLNEYDVELANPASQRQEETSFMTFCKSLEVMVTPRKC